MVLLLSGCLSEPDCVSTKNNSVQLKIRSAETNKYTKFIFSSITVSGTTDTFHTTDSIGTLRLPVDPFTSQTTYNLTYDKIVNSVAQTQNVSIILGYKAQYIIISTDCGPYLFCSDLTVVDSSMESKLLNSQLSTGETVNVEIKL